MQTIRAYDNREITDLNGPMTNHRIVQFGKLPELYPNGARLISFKQIMEQRLGAPKDVREKWRNVTLMTNMIAIRNDAGAVRFDISYGDIKVSDYKKMKPNELTCDLYTYMPGSVLHSDIVKKLCSSYGRDAHRQRRAFWEYAVGGDLTLLKAYRELLKKEDRDCYSMTVRPPKEKGVWPVRFDYMRRVDGSSAFAERVDGNEPTVVIEPGKIITQRDVEYGIGLEDILNTIKPSVGPSQWNEIAAQLMAKFRD